MPNEILIGILLALVVIAFAAGAVTAYLRMRPTRIASPQTKASGASVSAARPSGDTHTGASQIARHPNRKQAFRTMAQWYAGKPCAICGRDIPPLSHFGPEPGLLNATATPATTIAWTDVPVEQLSKILDTRQPVCSSCHLMTWFQHEYPDLLIDRHRTQETDVTMH